MAVVANWKSDNWSSFRVEIGLLKCSCCWGGVLEGWEGVSGWTGAFRDIRYLANTCNLRPSCGASFEFGGGVEWARWREGVVAVSSLGSLCKHGLPFPFRHPPLREKSILPRFIGGLFPKWINTTLQERFRCVKQYLCDYTSIWRSTHCIVV